MKVPQYKHYSSNFLPLFSINTNRGDVEALISNDEEHQYLMTCKGEFVFLVDVLKDSIIRTYNLSNYKQSTIIDSIETFIPVSISAPDTANFAILCLGTGDNKDNPTLYIYQAGHFKKTHYDYNTNGHVIYKHANIQYFPKYNIVVCHVMPINGREIPKDQRLNWEAFKAYRTDKDSSYLLPLIHPKRYFGYTYGIPHVHTSSTGKYLIVSFGYDEYVYKVDLSNNTIEKRIVIGATNDLNISPTKGKKGVELKDALLKATKNNDSYGIALWDTISNTVMRTYYPKLPEKKPSGAYFSNSEKSCHLLLSTPKNQFEYMLPGSDFYKSDITNWFYNAESGYYNFVKVLPHDNNKKVWNYYIVGVELYQH
ncbi:MAG: hypothetical protein QM530_00765 [Phycisphaerales bacterium]|nr:hypothetical protein [Phycisphaerales bacterium]